MKRTPKTYNAVFLAILAVGLVLLLLGAVGENLLLLGLGLLVAFGSFVFRVIFYRCPHCGYYLGRRDGVTCPHCKKNME